MKLVKERGWTGWLFDMGSRQIQVYIDLLFKRSGRRLKVGFFVFGFDSHPTGGKLTTDQNAAA